MTEKGFIGVFDSGVGGLSVLTKLIKDFPDESFVYLGDTARLPYGAKSKETIKKYVEKNINFLTQNYPIKAIVVACNSASSVLNELNLPVKTLGVIEAGSDAALSVTQTNSVALWATRATVKSKAYEKELLNMNSEIELISVSCPSLVTLVEEMGTEHPLLEPAFDYYLESIKTNPEVDCLILGCTHFPFFKRRLQNHLNEQNLSIELVDASDEVSVSLRNILTENKSGNITLSSSPIHHILVTDDADHFKSFISNILPKEQTFKFEKVDL